MTNKLQQLQSQRSVTEDVLKMDSQLGLSLPRRDISVDQKNQYIELFHHLRRLVFVNSAGNQEDVNTYLKEFESAIESKRSETLQSIINKIEAKIILKKDLDGLYGDDILLNKILITFNVLNDDGKAGLLYFIDTGKTADSTTDLSQYYSELAQMSEPNGMSAEDEAKMRLAQVMDRRQNFDARRDLNMGRPLTPSDIEGFIQNKR